MASTLRFALGAGLTAALVGLAACGDGDGDRNMSEVPVENLRPDQGSGLADQPSLADPVPINEDGSPSPTAGTGLQAARSNNYPPLNAPAGGASARAEIIGTDGEPTGSAIVADGPNGILLRVDVTGLGTGFHGTHLHQVGDCSDYAEGFQASGSHIDPEDRAHGLLNPDGYERGDLVNVYVHETGHGRAELFADGLTLEEAMDEDGFAIIIHVNPDDHLTQPIGGAGDRVGCAAFNGMPPAAAEMDPVGGADDAERP